LHRQSVFCATWQVSAYPTEAISGNKKSGAKEGKEAIGIGVAALRYVDRAKPAK